jgi:glutathione peroxidase
MKPRSLFLAAAAFTLTGVALAARPSYPKDVVKPPSEAPAVAKADQPASPLDFAVKDINGHDAKLSQYRGKVVMIVNVASKCGYTPQYEQLEAIYKKYADQGFVILGFPANNFNKQEPGTNEEIQTFCKSKYGVTFPMMSKISVLGEDKAPLYKFLTEQPTAGDFAGDIGWNFNKFIVDRNGNVIARYNSATKPDAKTVTDEIERALKAKAAVAAG